MSTEQIWYTRGLNKHLSDGGYVHFLTKCKVDDDFEENTAYYIDHDAKEFGLSDVISYEKADHATMRQSEYREHIAESNP